MWGVEGEKGSEKGVDIPLPDFVGGGAKDKIQLAEEQKDVSLKDIRKWAEKGK